MKEETINFTDGVKWFGTNKALNGKLDGFIYYSELKKNLSGTDNYISKVIDTILWERLYSYGESFTYVISDDDFIESYRIALINHLESLNIYDKVVKKMPYTDLRVKKIKTLAYYKALKSIFSA